jgi:hypothetical protein
MMSNSPSMLRCFYSTLLIAALSCHLSAQTPDAAEDIRGPKELVEIPVPEKPPIVLYSSIAMGVIFSVLAAYLWKRRGRSQQKMNPRELALSSLAELEATRETIAAEAFANTAAQTVRQYIADRFSLVAPRLTTEEFLHSLTKDTSSPLHAESDHLRAYLKSCDLAKFAGVNLDFNQRIELLEAARKFVRSTSQAVTP